MGRKSTPGSDKPVDSLPAIHPGEFLRDELQALGVSARKFADHIKMPHNAITGIMNGQRGISAEMALRLARAFSVSPEYWMNLQVGYELKRAQRALAVDLQGIAPLVT